jgi:hypothetical protein
MQAILLVDGGLIVIAGDECRGTLPCPSPSPCTRQGVHGWGYTQLLCLHANPHCCADWAPEFVSIVMPKADTLIALTIFLYSPSNVHHCGPCLHCRCIC